MMFNNDVLDSVEKIIFELRSLYNKLGYSQYKMSKFEEYDLYSRNKDFLISDGVITFTDTNGKLMALKPDVTLSIIKNNADNIDVVQKLYYNENVYRVSKGTGSFKEIMQSGLECMGAVDDYCIGEVLYLAAKSLKVTQRDFVLDVSQLDILSAILDKIEMDLETKDLILKCIGEKNIYEIKKIAINKNLNEEGISLLIDLLKAYGKPENVMGKVKEIAKKVGAELSAQSLENAINFFKGSSVKDNIRIDFSVISDMNYYNGIVFKGFIESIPGSVLSGGQYDKLMQKLSRKSKAVGFAVYLDLLDRLEEENEYDVDIMLLYSEDVDPAKLHTAISTLNNDGKSVYACKILNEKLKYKTLAKFENGEVVEIENNA